LDSTLSALTLFINSSTSPGAKYALVPKEDLSAFAAVQLKLDEIAHFAT
jgi:hypothetical protein